MTAFIASYHIWLGGLALIAYLTIGVIIPLIISKISGDDGMKFRSKSGALSGFVLDSLRGLSETIQYGQGQKRLAEMNKKTDELSADEERMKKIAGRNIAVTNTVILIFDFMMLFLSAYLYQTNAIGFDGILICTLALFSSFGPAIALANLGSTLQNTFASGSRVLDILEEEPLVEEIKDEKEVSFNGAKAENVTFAYKDEIILDNLSADIPKNSVVGIVGRSGSGKSTLLKLFMRFWKVENGSVKLSDTDIEHINTANLRNMESFVTQETHLFHDSIKNNIRIAKLNATDEVSADEERMKKIAGRNIAVTNTVILIFDFMMLFLSAYLYQTNAIGFDGILICTLALFSSFGPAIALANLGSTLQNTFASGSRVLDILEEEPLVEEIKDEKEVSFNGAKAENVTFAYKDEIILDNLSADIPKNSVVGIVGRSGSGKSTLLKLFMRFWKVENGSVKLSDTDIEHINTANLRNMESFVTQETHLFHDSIKNNIRIAKLNATDEEIKAACQKASVHEFIMTLPQGYDTQVGELGDTLSGGERQRIGLARAFLHDAPFMLLDEPTSNLDSLNEAVILRSLHEERNGKTVVLVSHRESTMRIADKIYSVEHGRMS